jgi:hypothetical protein
MLRTIITRDNSLSPAGVFNIPGLRNPRRSRPVRVSFRGPSVGCSGEQRSLVTSPFFWPPLQGPSGPCLGWRSYPSIEVDASLVFVSDGNIYTSGGITTGIDLALALVEEDLGTEAMLGVARSLVVFPRRPGGQSQFKGYTSILEKPIRPNISELQAWMLAHPEADFGVPALADRMAMSPRNFSRLFRSETNSRAIRRVGTRRCGPLQTRTNAPDGRDYRRAMRAMPNACGAHFSASSMSVRMTTGCGSDQLCSPEFYN